MTGKRNLPVLTNVRLRNFSLYKNNRNLEISIRGGVFCLAGANGMGKSSFLAAINFALTGAVPNPRRAFQGVDKFYSDSRLFASQYFDGRIAEDDRDESDITLDFRIGRHRYEITRNFFDPDGLRHLYIEDVAGNELLETTGWESRARHGAYKNRIVEDCNLANFQYFVFLQHMLLTFDERRHLLFWDPRAANLALYLAFGVAPEDTDRSEYLRLEIDTAESNAQNAQWQATIARNSLAKLAGSDTAGLMQLRETHNQLVGALNDAREEASLAERAADDAGLAAAGAAANQQALRREYDRAFSRKVSGNRDPARHPVVIQSLSDHICDVCGSESDSALSAIRKALSSQRCPLCCTPIQYSQPQDFAELQRLDDALSAAKEESDSAQARAERLRREAAKFAERATSAATALDKFEHANAGSMTGILSASAEIDQQRRSLEGEQRNATSRRDEFRRHRDKLRAELEPLQARLTGAYHDGELEFVPIFRSLATRFIGLDIDVSLYKTRNTFGLALEMQGTRRQSTTELSESQRFFLEIALKMALVQYMSSDDSPAGLLIDTPEGSLDIAYEARAGDMFADFVQVGFNLLMTANINSSQLLKRLAERCRSEFMELVRMTEWTSLTEVQTAEEHLFNEAYAVIESKLADEDDIEGVSGE
jgi:energy-coupling factor transporter ATP-binding protein EcfA2